MNLSHDPWAAEARRQREACRRNTGTEDQKPAEARHLEGQLGARLAAPAEPEANAVSELLLQSWPVQVKPGGPPAYAKATSFRAVTGRDTRKRPPG